MQGRGIIIYMYLPQNAEAYFSIAVEVRVESDSPTTSGHEGDPGGNQGVVRGEPNHKMEQPSLVGGIKWSRDQCMEL